MQRVLRLILVVLLSSLTACQIRPTRISRTAEASAQSTGEKTPQQLLSNEPVGHYGGTEFYFHQDVSTSHSVAIDFEHACIPIQAVISSHVFGTGQLTGLPFA